jgi:transcriptional regulator with XRE-family HTH domain
MKKYQKVREYTSPILANLLAKRDPAQTARTEARMMVAAKIYNALEAQSISQKDFALLLNQQPSVITKWLSGTHNFTLDTLVNIQKALKINLLDLEIEAVKDDMNPILEDTRRKIEKIKSDDRLIFA